MSVRYALRRVLQLLPAVIAIVVVGFLLIHLAPGDPILALAGEDGDAAYYARMRQRFGLDQPLHLQFLTYARNVLTGELGDSFVQGRAVIAVIGARLPATLLLTTTALAISTTVGVGLGIYTARRANRPADLVVNATMLTAHAAPVFWLGQLALLAFAGGLGWFPVQGMVSARETTVGLARVADIAYHLALPALVLASHQIALVTRLTRTSLLEELGAAHVRTARAKGLTERRVVYVHALRRALLSAATVVGGRVGHVLAGTVVVEVVFGWPGLGRLLLTSMQSRDQPVLLGLFLLISFTVVAANLLTDLAYGWLDPRIRFARE